mmetsp:Transcript_24299/g.61326  ORF Transcript_24299/g.61326 Transcript_24299/m.61326 type:complete len:489 (-) Transcript_24299:47-1513(-)
MGCGASTPASGPSTKLQQPIPYLSKSLRQVATDSLAHSSAVKGTNLENSLNSFSKSFFGRRVLREAATFGQLEFGRDPSQDGNSSFFKSIVTTKRINSRDKNRKAAGLEIVSRWTDNGYSKRPLALDKRLYQLPYGSFSQLYEVIHFIGPGGYSKIFEVEDRRTGFHFAAKVMETADQEPVVDRELRWKRKVSTEDVLNEARIMEALTFPTVVQFSRMMFEDGLAVILMQLAEGRDLYTELNELGRPLQECEAGAIFVDLLSSLALLHSKGIVHRDVKPENVLFREKLVFKMKESDEGSEVHFNEDNTALLSDFGLSWAFHIDHFPHHRFCGSTLYIPYEVVEAQANMEKGTNRTSDSRDGWANAKAVAYVPKMDMWSAGVVLYEMVTGLSPFLASTPQGTLVNILKTPLPLLEQSQSPLSSELCDLVNSLVTKDLSKRLTAVEALRHPWIKKVAPRRQWKRLRQLRDVEVETGQDNFSFERKNACLN